MRDPYGAMINVNPTEICKLNVENFTESDFETNDEDQNQDEDKDKDEDENDD